MNSLKKPMRLAKILAFALSFLMFCFPTAAMAAPGNFLDGVTQQIPITKGKFFVSATGLVPQLPPIQTAVVSLSPSEEMGRVNTILIIGPEGQPELSCQGISVKNGTDLIKECGISTPVTLEAGLTSYTAQGSNFSPNPEGTFSVELK